MPTEVTFESFERELNRLVESFGKRLAELKQPGYAEAQLRDDFLNPMFRALGWDMENRAGLIQKEREVEIESATQIGGGRKRADYLFRTDKRDRFVCEAKKPAEDLHARYAFQAKRYAWNKGVWVAVLTDFEELKVYLVGGKPRIDEPQVGEWKSWHFRQYPLIAREIWDLLARDKIAADGIDQLLEALPKKAIGTGKARQQWLIKPDRSRALDSDFLEFLDATRRDLAADIYKHNNHAELLEGNKLTESVQRIIDRILFLRICEDRDIDTGQRLESIVEKWRKNTGDEDTGRHAYQQPFELHDAPPADYGTCGIRAPKDSLWHQVVRHFRALDRRPPTHVPFFNGNLFKPDYTEAIVISDEWLAGFIGDLSDDESPYLFNVIDVEILGSVYERFLGKVVRPQGRGITIEDKPEVRKAGGVYYTPRYIVNYIVEQTAGKLLNGIASEKATEGLKAFATRTEKLRLLDPACGSGSFLIRAFERVCEHWQKRLTAALPPRIEKEARTVWEKKHRALCWVDVETGDVHLTVELKRKILTQNIYGVDLDAAAVEVTQLSLYLKMLENENRTTLHRQRELLAAETDIALLPPLQDNIKCGNSLIASDFSMLPADLVRVHAFDWPVQFAPIMKAGGFDAVIGNPPYGAELNDEERQYLQKSFGISLTDTAALFILLKQRLLKPHGLGGYIVPKPLLYNSNWREIREKIIVELSIACDCGKVWPEVKLEQVICVLEKASKTSAYTSASRVGQAIRHFGKLDKNLCAEFQFILSNVTPTEVKLAQKLKLSARYLGHILKNQRGAMLQSSVSAGTGFYTVLGGKQIGRFCLAETPKGRLAKAAVTDAKALVKSNSVLVQNIVAHIENPVDHIRIIATVLPNELQGNSVILDTINQLSVAAPFSALFVAALLNSKLINWFTYRFIFARAIRTMHFDAPVTDRIPLCNLDFSSPADKDCHDTVVEQVDRLLLLVPKLRSAVSESETATLQNAIAAAEQRMDALVYQLYGLTPDEINIVEGS
ncbi:MAG: DNA methyltransferase [Verrucomicrobiota bacterium]